MAITSDVAGQLLTKQYRKEKIFGIRDHPNPFKSPGSVRDPHDYSLTVSQRHPRDNQLSNGDGFQCFDQTDPSLVKAGAHKEISKDAEMPRWSRATCEFRYVMHEANCRFATCTLKGLAALQPLSRQLHAHGRLVRQVE